MNDSALVKHSPQIRTLLVDDQELFREAIRTVLELDERFQVVGEAGNGTEAIRIANHTKPDVVLMDLRMPGISGLEATRRILDILPETRLLVLTTFDEGRDVLAAMLYGASGYVLKNMPSAELKAAIQAVARGGCYLEPSVANYILQEYRRLAQNTRDPSLARLAVQLSQREKDILRQLMHGQSNKEIAGALGITEGTVKNHMTSIMTKFKASDRTSVALKARELGLK